MTSPKMPQSQWSDFAEGGAGEVTREDELEAALQNIVSVIRAAGAYQLSRGVELGPTVWFVKISAALEWADILLPPPPENAE